MARKKAAKATKDLALVYGPTEDGEGWRILRQRRGSTGVEAGQIRPLRAGRAISGEVVKLDQRREAPFLFDVETDEELSSPAPPAGARTPHGGPAQVATEDYRRGWEAIWGTRPRGAALN